MRGLLLALVLLAGCGSAPAEPPVCKLQRFENAGFTVCRYDPAESELKLALDEPKGPLGGLAALKTALGADAGRVQFAMNGGMYDPDQRPVGLYVEAGKRRKPARLCDGPSNFCLKPNGVFWTAEDGTPHLDETSLFIAGNASPRWATQSGPLLVQAGRLHPKISPDGPSRLIRNGVGVCGGKALFVVSEDPVSLGKLARFFRDGLNCPDALHIDGTVSSLWAPNLGRMDGRTDLGPLIVVLRRP
ncbi:uncharacterized protein YigE (DUF2233 family) [Caulobacter ginsengisoli]|uniref:Uncharacterized protein YigE (DUF2233 family) n=1 Tax=Caulobacter ginsengisoli TaxID=400775 RepID=A0ABU0IU19_9CAUL|nr:phosphodiester glycosidase family protein [Caulobacter ginsengisoli]MDQ0465502.1 uncharacterized protein YigE (DUF2233 family) [Caulobacter ginsengisoli]